MRLTRRKKYNFTRVLRQAATCNLYIHVRYLHFKFCNFLLILKGAIQKVAQMHHLLNGTVLGSYHSAQNYLLGILQDQWAENINTGPGANSLVTFILN